MRQTGKPFLENVTFCDDDATVGEIAFSTQNRFSFYVNTMHVSLSLYGGWLCCWHLAITPCAFAPFVPCPSTFWWCYTTLVIAFCNRYTYNFRIFLDYKTFMSIRGAVLFLLSWTTTHPRWLYVLLGIDWVAMEGKCSPDKLLGYLYTN